MTIYQSLRQLLRRLAEIIRCDDDDFRDGDRGDINFYC